MIYKELDLFQSDDKFAKTGRAAEEQMAFYFKRFFGDDPDILVLNGIRLEANGDAAQVDHLVIHSHGLALVESKSVHGKIQIKEDGQWIRWFGSNQSRGMASPIVQARLQEKFFRSVLGKAAKNEELFAKIPIDLYVAISDSGVIIWPPSGHVQCVCKADQVPDKIIARKRSMAEWPGALVLSPMNREKIAAFLVANNKPLVRVIDAPAEPRVEPVKEVASPTPVVVQEEPVASPAEHCCKHCGSPKVSVQYGKFGYYFKCAACDGNTPIKISCGVAGHKEKIRKDGLRFYRECAECKTTSLFFQNAVAAS